MFKHKPMTFNDIDNMTLNQFRQKGSEAFKPSDILDIDASDDSADEILKKFKRESPNQSPKGKGKRIGPPRQLNNLR